MPMTNNTLVHDIAAAAHPNIDSFIAARTAQWAQVASIVCPSQDVLPILEALWTQEWMAQHVDLVSARMAATRGLTMAELQKYADLGGLRECVIQLDRSAKALGVSRDQNEALREALTLIAAVRLQWKKGGDVEAMLDKIALFAHQALAFGRTPVTEATIEDESAAGTGAGAASVDKDMEGGRLDPMASPNDAQSPSTGTLGNSNAKLKPGMEIFTVERFRSISAVRSLTRADGEAFASNGSGYDQTRQLDPASPVPAGIAYVAWKDFGTYA